MTEVGGYCLDVCPLLQGKGGVRVPQIMEAGGGDTGLCCTALEILIGSVLGDMIPQLVCEHKAFFIFPALAGFQLHFTLLGLLPLQHFYDVVRDHEGSALTVFQRQEFVFGSGFTLLLQLAVDGHHAGIKVNAVPGQADDLALPQSGKHGDIDQFLIGISLDGFQQSIEAFTGHRMHFSLADLGQGQRATDICRDITQLDCLAEGTVQHAVHVLDGLRGQAFPLPDDVLALPVLLLQLIRFHQLVVHMLDHRGGQLWKTYSTEVGLQVYPDLILVLVQCGGLYILVIVLNPDIQPGPEGHLRGLRIHTQVNLAGDLLQPYPHFLLRFTVDRFLVRFPGTRIKAV